MAIQKPLSNRYLYVPSRTDSMFTIIDVKHVGEHSLMGFENIVIAGRNGVHVRSTGTIRVIEVDDDTQILNRQMALATMEAACVLAGSDLTAEDFSELFTLLGA